MKNSEWRRFRKRAIASWSNSVTPRARDLREGAPSFSRTI